MAQNENIKIFIAYSREDQHILNRLRTNLKVLERTQNIQVWYDGEIEVGSDWQKQIKTNLYSADIILLLVSENFIASDYCYDTEMTEALSLHDQNKVRTVPVIAKECLWQRMPFARLQALPEDGKAITAKDWDTPNRPYLQIVTQLENIVKDIRAKRHQSVKAVQQNKQRNAQKEKFNTLLQKGKHHFQHAEWQKASTQFQQAIGMYEASFGTQLEDLQKHIQDCNREMGYDAAFREANMSYAKADYKTTISHIETALQLKKTPEAKQLLADAKNHQKLNRQNQIDGLKKNKFLRFGIPALLLALLTFWGISSWTGNGDDVNGNLESSSQDSTTNPTAVLREDTSVKKPIKIEEEKTPKEETLPAPSFAEVAQKKYQQLIEEGDRYLRRSDYQNAKDKYQAAQKTAKGFSFSTRDAKDGIKKCEDELEEIRQKKDASLIQKRNEAARKKKEEAKPKPKPSKPKLPQVIIDFENNMKKIPSGTFTMGCKEGRDKDCGGDEKPAHSVSVSSFYMNKYEVTQEVWRAVMGSDPPELKFKGCDKCPVERVSWNDSQEFLKKLNKMTGRKYRLPTEAEWEYAARGGQDYQYAGSNTLKDVAWYSDNSGKKTHPVGQLSPNGYGLYDMSGNVYEWCEDYYHKTYDGAPTNGSAWNTGGDKKHRVLRGGSWYGNYFNSNCRTAYRYRNNPTDRNDGNGLRCARAH